MHRHSSAHPYGDGIIEWRREGGKLKEEDCERGKAGDEGPVTGGVEVRYEVPNVWEVALCMPSW